MAKGTFLTTGMAGDVVILIDNFASELDTGRRRMLMKRLQATHAQVFVSAMSANQIRDITDEKGKMFKVEQGKIASNSKFKMSGKR